MPSVAKEGFGSKSEPLELQEITDIPEKGDTIADMLDLYSTFFIRFWGTSTYMVTLGVGDELYVSPTEDTHADIELEKRINTELNSLFEV